MALHGPDVIGAAKRTLSNGLTMAIVFDGGQPQGTPHIDLWWRLEQGLPPASAVEAAIVAMLPPADSNTAVKTCTRSESKWTPIADLASAKAAATIGANSLDAWWVGRPSAGWWGGLAPITREGFRRLLADCP